MGQNHRGFRAAQPERLIALDDAVREAACECQNPLCWKCLSATATLVLTETGGPIRTIITGRRHVTTGAYASRKAGRALPYESMNERAFFMHSEVDTNVVDYRAQPFRIEFAADGRKRTYIVDCVRQLSGDEIEVVEVKNDRRALRDPDYQLKLECVRAICEQERWVVVRPKPEGFPNAWQTRVMLWFLIALALTAPLGWLFARRITAPLRGFAEAADRLGRDPTAPVLVGEGGAEIGRAARAFNLMQARLRRYVDDRTAMIGAISHDLRTPLARMRFRVERTPDDVRPAFERDIEQMNAMIESVLVFMRDRSELATRQRVDLRSVLEVAVDDAVEAGGKVELEPGDQAEAEVDLLGIQRVFANLLDNALKYGDRAVVRLRLDGVEAVVQVIDFGPGLPPEELDRVFRPFYRTPRAWAGETQGVGLGLATVRSIVRAHGGDVRLSSDKGLIAEVRLPVAA